MASFKAPAVLMGYVLAPGGAPPLADAVRALEHQDGPNLPTPGSGDRVRRLLAAGLVDKLRLLIHPIVLGPGRRPFSEEAQPPAFPRRT